MVLLIRLFPLDLYISKNQQTICHKGALSTLHCVHVACYGLAGYMYLRKALLVCEAIEAATALKKVKRTLPRA